MPEAKENSSADKVDENTKLSDNNGLSEDVDVRMSEEEQETGENKARNDEISNGKDESKEEKVKHHGRDKFDRIGSRADSPNSEGSED